MCSSTIQFLDSLTNRASTRQITIIVTYTNGGSSNPKVTRIEALHVLSVNDHTYEEKVRLR